ncbi:hypothetical protein [Pseudochelatococcus contaminans]|uniref:DUF4760 domain-containing protein n=1 Tax=Pseudochelatococcus contaminans TaxID=1538103 RepID=A0A7W5Z899_9HYPH|nr:hypothetical protein [Pseudochelatococcus contaminans]MBB3811464.1 hypothetical protein [Pseudochelatococcus contaminans]
MTLATPIHELANLSDIATIIASIIGTISLIIAATSIRLQYKSSENQFKLNNLIEYTKRYSSIIDRMPVNVYDWDFDASSIENEHERNELKKALYRYFELSFEEWALWKNGRIDSDIWEIWRGGIETAMKRPVFRNHWDEMELKTELPKDFRDFIRSLYNKNKI